MRIDPFDNFPVQLHHHAQHAMRGGMLWAEIDGVIGNFPITHGLRIIRRQIRVSGGNIDLIGFSHGLPFRLWLGRSARLGRSLCRSGLCSGSLWCCGLCHAGLACGFWLFCVSCGCSGGWRWSWLCRRWRRRRWWRGRDIFFITRQNIFRAFPWAHEIKAAEILRQGKRVRKRPAFPLRYTAAQHSRRAGNPCGRDGR